MTLEERILKLKDSQVGWFDGYELRVIAEDVCKMEKRIKRMEEAGDALLELCEANESQFHLADQIDARCEQWIKAKEVKP